MTAYLVIDTSTRYGTVGLWADGLSRAATWRSRNNHTSELMPAVQWLLDAEGLSPSGLDGVIVAVGPGGFSALRTGLGVAKGLALAASLQIAGVSSLEAMAYAWRDSAVRVCALLSVGRDAVAWGAFGSTGGVWQALSDEHVSTVAEFAHAQPDGETLFCGEASDAVRDALRDRLGTTRASPRNPPRSSGSPGPPNSGLRCSPQARRGLPRRWSLATCARPPSRSRTSRLAFGTAPARKRLLRWRENERVQRDDCSASAVVSVANE